MDSYLAPCHHGERWSGIVHVLDDEARTLAHGQQIRMPEGFPTGKAMIYEAKVDFHSTSIDLCLDDVARYVCIPADECITMGAMKEVCSGLGCISMAAEFLGIRAVASMDINEKAVNTMWQNGGKQALLGDITKAADRYVLHITPSPLRGILAAGFPCQPLSRQGDMLGQADVRSLVFYATTRITWEQQMAAALLECVPGAMSSGYVQHELQKLSSSMGMFIYQRILNLSKFWPNSRTRWWCLLVIRPIQIPHIPDLPNNEEMRHVEHLFKLWPIWNEEVERELALREDELALYHDPAMGDDQRHLCQNKPCPCFLHSYGNLLDKCPCGCRQGPMSWQRLQQGGARGFYVISQSTGKPRYLAAAEACALATIPSGLEFESQRLGLAFVGQSAAPVQAIWMMAHLQKATVKPDLNPETMLYAWTAERLRELWGTVTFPMEPDTMKLQVWNNDALLTTDLKISQGSLAGHLKKAETKLQGHDLTVKILDGMGTIPDNHKLHMAPATGCYVLWEQAKKQSQPLPSMEIDLVVHHDGATSHVPIQMGAFVFEGLSKLHIHPGSGSLQDEHGQPLDWDQRVYGTMELQLFRQHAFGESTKVSMGLNDYGIDSTAFQMIDSSGKAGMYWIPAIWSTRMFADMKNDAGACLWLPAALHGHLLTCVCWDNHWVLVHAHVQGTLLNVEIWDGLMKVDLNRAMKLALTIKDRLAIRTLSVQVRCEFSQQYSFTCGTVALMHLAHILDHWMAWQPHDELQWHVYLLVKFAKLGNLTGLGLDHTQEEKEVIWKLREILEEKGVPTDHTEERAHHALAKIGLSKLQQALASRNIWASLKSLGSAPRINFLWVKPAELDMQIRKKAQDKFQVASSSKKTGRGKKSPVQDLADPNDLQLIAGTFVDENEEDCKQIALAEVGSNRSGIAFVHLSDAAPYLQGTESLSLGGLALLTTAPVPQSTQGLLPVSNLRYPAIYVPTGEAVLIDGSLIQLGDTSISRRVDKSCIQMTAVETVALKLTIYRDQWPGDWEAFTHAPVKTLLQKFPPLQLCKGNRCGDTCAKFHPPVDTELDSVLSDVWSRMWISIRGKKVAPDQADAYQVMIRVPEMCMKNVHWLSGVDGLYVEPRAQDGRSPDDSYAVVWMEDSTFQEVCHKQKTTDRTLPITRFGNKYGIRVYKKDLETVQTKLGIEDQTSHISVQKIYELRPLPFGTLKKALQTMLTAWGWEAKPIQPGRADAAGMSWKVGPEKEPPSMIMQTSNGDVAITLQKQVMSERSTGHILSSNKTQAHLRKQSKERDSKSKGKENAAPSNGDATESWSDPWWKRGQHDPWGKWHPKEGEDVPMTVQPKLDTIQDTLRKEVSATIAEKTDSRLNKLETDIHEMRNQHVKYEQWFAEAGAANQNLQGQLNTVVAQVAEQKSELSTMGSEIKSGFANLEALLAKKARTE